MASKNKSEKTSEAINILSLVTKFLKVADEAIRSNKEIVHIGKLKLPFGLKTASAMYKISFKPLKKKRD